MKSISIFRTLLAAIALSACSSLVSYGTSKHQDWDFIQKVGGVDVGDLQKLPDGGSFLPVKVDVSGLMAVTRKPETMNSALVVRRVGHRVEADKIEIWVETCPASKEHDSPVSEGTSLTSIPPGTYLVRYVDPNGSTHDIRHIEVSRPH